MLRNKNIAFFIDVDNVDLTTENYDNILAQLEGMGTILTGKVYGAKERKHKGIYESAQVRGFKVERTMRIKRRGRKDFDSRIFVDVVDAVCKAPSIDAVCIITASCDLVYLYSYLHGKGIKIISSPENEDASAELVDEIVDLGRVYQIKIPQSKPKTVSKSKTAARPVAVKTVKVEQKAEAKDDNTDELLREIARLRSLAEEQQAEKEAQSKSFEEAKKRAAEEAKAREEAEAKARAKAIEEARAKAYEEAQAKIKAEEDAKAKAKADAENKAKAEAEAKRKAEEEAIAKAKAEEEAKRKAEQDAKAREEEIAKAREKAYEEAKKKAYEEARKEAEKEAQARLKAAEQEARARAEEEALAKVKAEEEAKRKAIEEAERIRKEAEARQKAYEEAKAREEELNRRIAELEAKRQAEEQAKNVEGAEELMLEIETLKRLTSETNKLVKEMKDDPREQVILQYGVAEPQAAAEPAVTEAASKPVAKSTTESVQKMMDEADEQSAPVYGAPRAYYIPQNDGTLIRKIEEIRKNNGEGDTDELLEEIRKLLDGLD